MEFKDLTGKRIEWDNPNIPEDMRQGIVIASDPGDGDRIPAQYRIRMLNHYSQEDWFVGCLPSDIDSSGPILIARRAMTMVKAKY